MDSFRAEDLEREVRYKSDQMKHIIAIVGARPQFIKHAPLELANKESPHPIKISTIHTGQHYDADMSDIFFFELGMNKPTFMLHIGSHSHGKQTAMMIEKIEEIILDERPDGILVYGDTNSTLAGALVGAKLHIPIFHVEAGLRSFNKEMPEEINRIITDHCSNILFAPTDVAIENLQNEGIFKNVVKSGDLMYDMILQAKNKIDIKSLVEYHNYYLATIHRPYNTDDLDRILSILKMLDSLDEKVVFPMHPRTKILLQNFDIDLNKYSNIDVLSPVSYFSNVALMNNANAIITDSGGMQKEAYFLQKKCITIRKETEWIETLEGGWNHLVFEDLSLVQTYLKSKTESYTSNLYGSGNSANEILSVLSNF